MEMSPCTAHTIRNLILDRIDKLTDTPADLDEMNRLLSASKQLGMESLSDVIKNKVAYILKTKKHDSR